ncbi:MAG TPA: YCF48-related protein [Paludibacter sp.]
MKKLYLITIFTSIFIFVVNIETTFAQWTTQTSPLGLEILGKMQIVSATEGWIACGNSGNLLHTTNAGTQWNVVTPFPADTSMSNPSDVGLTMSWPNATHGWALKTYGSLNDPNGATMYQTVNGGTNWTKKDFPKLVASVTYSAADLVGTWQMHALSIDNPADASINNGWVRGIVTVDAIGNSITDYTDNNGQNGSRNSTASTINSKGIITLSGTDVHGFMSADKNTIIYTQSAGTSGYMLIIWQKVNPSTVYTTADLQGTWELHSIQTQPHASWIHGTTVMDATGNGTTSVITANGPVNQGFSGSLSSTGILTSAGSDFHGFLSADKQTLFITQSGDGVCNLSIMQKKQNAITYSADDMVGIWQLHSLTIGSSSSAWIHCQYKINASGSISATKMSRNNEAMSNMTSSISISADGTLTGFGSADADGFLSADKSLGLNTLSDGSGGYYLAIYQKDLSANGDGGMQVQFADNNTGWASVYNSLYGYFLLYKTTNGGTNWDVINSITNAVGGFYYFVDALNGWMFGASLSTTGTNTDILHTTDGGLSWTTQATNVGSVKAIYFSDVLHGWIVGRNALLMKTTDGGANWTTLTNTNQNPEAQFRSVYALNANVCYFGSSVPNTSSGQYILKTTDGGNSWTPTQVPIQYSVFNVVFWDENNGWISGDYGEIAHYSNNTGIQNPLSNDKSELVYPNPVIDFINIKSESEISNAKIYDISGNCVLNKSLVEDNRIDVRKLPAGIYFIKLPDSDKSNYIRFIKK